MYHQTLKIIRAGFSGQAAKEHVADIIRHHRIQATPGYRAAAQQVRDRLTGWGLDADLLSFSADQSTRFWSMPMFQEWTCYAATLQLIEPPEEARSLADYESVKLSVIQRSTSWHGEAEVVVLEDGTEEEHYAGLDVAGKIVLTDGDLDRVRQLACQQRGAVGLIHDGMRDAPPVRERWDLPDALQYTSFWWAPEDEKTFGFVLSPREGDRLRKLIAKRRENGEGRVRVRAHVDTEFKDGEIEVVTAIIPGETDAEVWVLSHLCHPQPSANDNASGAATAMEIARTLQRLIEAGDLAAPRRSIRFIWMPEMTGTLAYLATHEALIPRAVAAINLDMVGEDQEQTGSSLLMIGSPHATPSFADTLAVELFKAVSDDARGFGGTGGYPLFRWAETPYMPGSDHYILADPTVGIPCPMLNQWPDKFYHTSFDTLDRVSPHMLARAGTIAGTYAYFLANAGPHEAMWLAHAMVARFKRQTVDRMNDAVTQAMGVESDEAAATLARQAAALQRRTDYETKRAHEALQSLHRLSSDLRLETHADELDRFAQSELSRTLTAIREHAAGLGIDELPALNLPEPDEVETRAAQMVPHRLHRGPIDMATRDRRRLLSPEDQERLYRLGKEHPEAIRLIPVLALYRADGRRTLAEIIDLVELETGKREAELLIEYFELLERMELIEL
ncbi:MAG: DUF4910 domain-containing protein [Anaerolineae bacterium]